MRLRAELAILAVTIVWGATFVIVKSALHDVSTVLFLTLRFLLASAVLALVYRSSLHRRQMAAAARPGLLAGLFLAAAYLLQTAGLEFTTPSKSAFLTSLCVVLVPLLGTFVSYVMARKTGRPFAGYQIVPRNGELLAIALAMTGMWLLTAPETGADWNQGDLLTVGAAWAFAAHILVLGRFASQAGFTGISLWQIFTATALFAASVGWMEPIRFRPTRPAITAIIFTGLLCTAVAFTVQAWAQQHTTPTRIALIFAGEPVAAAATSYMTEGEILSTRAALGAGLILAGIIAAETIPRPTASTGQSPQDGPERPFVGE
ncbi:MAG: DMT family transporter [Acidobacteriia bacterium]|nr:DMT family transporter [Terriglobia bacterium]